MDSNKVDGKKHQAWAAFEDAKNAMYDDVKLSTRPRLIARWRCC